MKTTHKTAVAVSIPLRPPALPRGFWFTVAALLVLIALTRPSAARACGSDLDAAAVAAAPAIPLAAPAGAAGGDIWSTLAAEAVVQQQFWGSTAPATLYYYQDGTSPNAWAFADGSIRFGVNFVQQHLSAHGDLALTLTLAHEWAHRIQMTEGWANLYSAAAWRELEADAFAGYYMARQKALDWGVLQPVWQHIASMGDFAGWNDPMHHGTPKQREAATYLGVALGKWQTQTGASFTYAAMHEYFLARLTNIVQTVR